MPGDEADRSWLEELRARLDEALALCERAAGADERARLLGIVEVYVRRAAVLAATARESNS